MAKLVVKLAKISTSRRGKADDDAACESFIKTLEDEKVYFWEYKSVEGAEKRISHFIKDMYDGKQLHSLLRYRPPNELEQILIKKQLYPVRSL